MIDQKRLQEWLDSAPRITKADRRRLRDFTPKVKPMVLAVHLALQMWRWA